MEALLKRIENPDVDGLALGVRICLVAEGSEAVSERDGEAEVIGEVAIMDVEEAGCADEDLIVFGEEGLGDVEAEDGTVGGVELEDAAGIESKVGAALVVVGLV